jgi:hypothetical protein
MKHSIKRLIISIIIVFLLLEIPNNNLISNISNVAEAATVKINKSKLIMVIGTTYQLKLTGATSKIGWSSSKKTIATVTSEGKVTAKKNGKASITATVEKKKYTCEVTITVLDTTEKIEEYIYQRYATLKTDLGTFKLIDKEEFLDDDYIYGGLQVEENEKVNYPYDYRILIRWHAGIDYPDHDPVQWQYNDILESIKYTDEQKSKFKKAFLKYQKKMALDLMNVLPDKKIFGGFVTDGYKYPYSKVGWYENLFMTWRNYDIGNNSDYDIEYGDYYESTIVDFQWND